jgi:hypothetical protein
MPKVAHSIPKKEDGTSIICVASFGIDNNVLVPIQKRKEKKGK